MRQGRRSIIHQRTLLQQQFRGHSERSLLVALTISYLRRNTPHSNKARALFFRLWDECGEELGRDLSPRWLLSALRTFHDHGATETQRKIGLAGTVYGYMIRIYESERVMSGLPKDALYVRDEAEPELFGFKGMTQTRISHNDSMYDLHRMLLDLALADQGAGRALQAFLEKAHDADIVFKRADTNRDRMLGDKSSDRTPHWSFFHRRGGE